MEERRELLKKLLNLNKQGVKGEAQAAQNLLNKLLDKYELKLDDIVDTPLQKLIYIGHYEENRDSLYKQVVAFTTTKQLIKPSWLQRQFRIGYNRAWFLIDLLEENNIIGPANSTQYHQVYIQRKDLLLGE